MDNDMDQIEGKRELAVFGGGCFWCTEAVFELLDGVTSVLPGFAGGNVPNATYAQVCTGRTGHAEVARIEFDPARISYRELLEVFFSTHDPTTLIARAWTSAQSIAPSSYMRRTSRSGRPTALSRN